MNMTDQVIFSNIPTKRNQQLFWQFMFKFKAQDILTSLQVPHSVFFLRSALFFAFPWFCRLLQQQTILSLSVSLSFMHQGGSRQTSHHALLRSSKRRLNFHFFLILFLLLCIWKWAKKKGHDFWKDVRLSFPGKNLLWMLYSPPRKQSV